MREKKIFFLIIFCSLFSQIEKFPIRLADIRFGLFDFNSTCGINADLNLLKILFLPVVRITSNSKKIEYLTMH